MASFSHSGADGKTATTKADKPRNSTKSIEWDLLDFPWISETFSMGVPRQTAVSRGGKQAYPQPKTEETRNLQREKWMSELSITQGAAARFFFERGEDLFWIDSSGKKLTSSYRRLARILHPDRHHSQSESVKKSYAQEFNRLHEAYQILKNSPLGMPG